MINMRRDQKIVIFKKNLTEKDSEVAFDFLAKHQIHDVARQSAWIQIKGLLKYETEQEIKDPTVLTILLKNASLDLVVHTGETEFAAKNRPQSLSITKDGNTVSSIAFLKAETYEQLMGILNCINTKAELSLWARLDANEIQLGDFKDLNIPIQHLTLTFS